MRAISARIIMRVCATIMRETIMRARTSIFRSAQRSAIMPRAARYAATIATDMLMRAQPLRA